jgi:hypothetical protein
MLQACRDLCLHIQMSGQILHFLETVILHLLRQSSTVLYKKSAMSYICIQKTEKPAILYWDIDIDIQNIVIDMFGIFSVLYSCEY